MLESGTKKLGREFEFGYEWVWAEDGLKKCVSTGYDIHEHSLGYLAPLYNGNITEISLNAKTYKCIKCVCYRMLFKCHGMKW